MVLTALEEAKHMSTAPSGLYAKVLETRIKEVRQKKYFGHKNPLTVFNVNVAILHLLYSVNSMSGLNQINELPKV